MITIVNRVLIEDYEFLRDLLKSKLDEFEQVVVLGCTGMLGYYISAIAALHCANESTVNKSSVVGVSRSKDEKIRLLEEQLPGTFKNVTFEELERQLSTNLKTLVIHAASPSSFQSVLDDPAGIIYTNIELTRSISRIMQKHGGHIVFLSSGEVYGDSAPHPTKENDYSPIDHLSSRGAYPELKRAAEVILETYTKSSENLSATSLRVFHTFGPGIDLSDPRIFGLVCKSIQEKKEIKLNTDGSAVRSFLYSRDLVSAILLTIRRKEFGVFNVAGSSPISVVEFCKLSIPLGVPEIVFNNEEDKIPRNSQTGSANTEKLEAIGWKPLVTTQEALQRTVDSLE
jgi:UDP-glucuronate decarboxylase